MNLPNNCPACAADLRDGEIPAELRPLYGGAAHGWRWIGRVVNDRVQSWDCPDCGKSFPRDFSQSPAAAPAAAGREGK